MSTQIQIPEGWKEVEKLNLSMHAGEFKIVEYLSNTMNHIGPDNGDGMREWKYSHPDTGREMRDEEQFGFREIHAGGMLPIYFSPGIDAEVLIIDRILIPKKADA